MHLGVVKVGLLRLAKLEVISLHLILAKTKNSTLDNFSSNFDNPYFHRHKKTGCEKCKDWTVISVILPTNIYIQFI